MGFIRRLDNNADPQAFPGALFELAGIVPAPQCSEAQIEGTTGRALGEQQQITDTGKFAGFDLTGKHVTVTLPLPDAGTYGITLNDDDNILTDHTFSASSDDVNYYIHDGGELILTRNVKSFAQYIHAAGYAYTIKGGKLYTNMPSGQLKNACTILFDPIT